ncbi:MAG: Rpn family recombination-promoting nuclease/putative transposase [Treponemataceae bacterium]|jgi:predicted transposase/invertase (TIGR01784 family)|nr:Rpn family recombination-promoting nuclease/putative transposase [Treponemataceae bacterium]
MPLKPIEELTFADDFMFGRVMQNPEICKGLLERLLEIKIEKVEYPTLQKSISPHYKSKGVRLDVYVQDSDRVFDIEIQNFLDENLPKRTRYYQSMMDIDLLLKGKNYTQLKESFVIFVCKEDFFGENMPCYFFSNTCRDKSDLQLGDKAYKVIFNASAFENEKDVEKKSILEYIIDKKSTSEFTTKLDTLVEQTKVNEIFKGDYMAWGLAEFDAEQRGYKDGISEGIQQGAYEKAIETAKNLLKENISPEIIARTTGLSVDFLKTIK